MAVSDPSRPARGTTSADHPGDKGTADLEDPGDENGADADVPGVEGGLILIQPQFLFGVEKGRPQHKQHHGDRAGGIQPQRHGRDVVPPGAAGQGEGQQEEHQIAEQHPDGGTGNHVLQGKCCRKVKNAGQQADGQQQIGDVI